MKTYKNLYPQVCSLENLELAWKKARKGKTKKDYVVEFEKNLEHNLHKLQQELETLTYRPRALHRFVLHDPKTRVIHASDFRDRVVHHALCNIIEPIFDKTFIYDSYANRKNKGTHAALKRFDHFKRKVTKNGKLTRNAKNNNTVVGYALKADIRHYFATVGHKILISIIKKKIPDKKVIWLVSQILKNHNGKVPGKGMPIGNLTSQFFANVYLNWLDYFVKHCLKAKYYIRYVDDFVILHNSKSKLEFYRKQIGAFLKQNLKLELHPEKCGIKPLSSGIKFLGFRVFYHYKLLKKSNIRVIEKRLRTFERLYENGKMSYEGIQESVEGWMAYAKNGNTFKLRENILLQLGNIGQLKF